MVFILKMVVSNSGRFPLGSKKRRFNNDDKHDQVQKKRCPSIYVERKKNSDRESFNGCKQLMIFAFETMMIIALAGFSLVSAMNLTFLYTKAHKHPESTLHKSSAL